MSPNGSFSSGYTYYLAKFMTPITGIYKIVVNFSTNVSASSYWRLYFPDNNSSMITASNYMPITVGSIVNGAVTGGNSGVFGFHSDSTQQGNTRTIYAYARAGEPFIVTFYGNAYTAINITKITITY